MPYFKGNDGNLMQHWVLCELLTIARQYKKRLTFVDAHAMAPIADQRTGKPDQCGKFDAVFERLPKKCSPYEEAWKCLASERNTYPNSANFVSRIWDQTHSCSMLLCECDKPTVSFLLSWKAEQERTRANLRIEIASGNWRSRFELGLPEQEQNGLVFLSFDPYMFNRHCRNNKPRNMYPEDLDLVGRKTSYYKAVLLQLSTYSANDDNPQNKVVDCVQSRLKPYGFEQIAAVKTNGAMMSLIYQRGIDFINELASLELRFREWFEAVKRPV